MKAMILAAGLGTRLRPWTLSHPKALVPVDGVPMLERVINVLIEQGFDRIVINVHHFADQITDFLHTHKFDAEICVSDERKRLLDTGGALLHAKGLLTREEGPVLIHNVDILSDADLRGLMRAHEEGGNASTLLVSDRTSSRKLIFDREMILRGWHNVAEGHYRPRDYELQIGDVELAFSGIHVVSEEMLRDMERLADAEMFSVIDYLLSPAKRCEVKGYRQDNLHLIDIGKPATLSRANDIIKEIGRG